MGADGLSVEKFLPTKGQKPPGRSSGGIHFSGSQRSRSGTIWISASCGELVVSLGERHVCDRLFNKRLFRRAACEARQQLWRGL